MSRTFDFMRHRHLWVAISAVAVLASLVALSVRGLNLGLDFTGGSMIELAFSKPVSPEGVRTVLVAGGFDDTVVQMFGTERDVLLRVPPREGREGNVDSEQILELLRAEFDDGVQLEQANFIGPAVGDELVEDGLLAIFASMVVIMVYILFRFSKQFAIGSVIALVHDTIVTLGSFAVFRWTFDLAALAAVLAVIGYSLNDTIVIYDRVREVLRKSRRPTLVPLINRALNETLGRTIATAGTTLFVVVSLLVFGGESVRSFALALTIGIVAGTYSSIYVAAPALLWFRLEAADLVVQPDREDTP